MRVPLYEKVYDEIIKVDPDLKSLVDYVRPINYTRQDANLCIGLILRSKNQSIVEQSKQNLIKISMPLVLKYAYEKYIEWGIELAELIQNMLLVVTEYVNRAKFGNWAYESMIKFHLGDKLSPNEVDHDIKLVQFDKLPYYCSDEYLVYDPVEYSLLRNDLIKVMKAVLSDREMNILIYRFGFMDGECRTLDEVGKIYGVTRNRIRQIEWKALMKMRGSEEYRWYLKQYVEAKQ